MPQHRPARGRSAAISWALDLIRCGERAAARNPPPPRPACSMPGWRAAPTVATAKARRTARALPRRPASDRARPPAPRRRRAPQACDRGSPRPRGWALSHMSTARRCATTRHRPSPASTTRRRQTGRRRRRGTETAGAGPPWIDRCAARASATRSSRRRAAMHVASLLRPANGTPACRSVRNFLQLRIDHLVGACFVLGPRRDQPPAQQPGLGPAPGRDDRQHLVGGSDVVTTSARLAGEGDFEAFVEFLHTGGVRVAPAHAPSIGAPARARARNHPRTTGETTRAPPFDGALSCMQQTGLARCRASPLVSLRADLQRRLIAEPFVGLSVNLTDVVPVSVPYSSLPGRVDIQLSCSFQRLCADRLGCLSPGSVIA